jgi:hypothetical protein
VTALTDALDNADREIDLAEAALAEAKWLMIWFERADDESRPETERKLLRELDSAARAATAARRYVARSLPRSGFWRRLRGGRR